MEFESPSEKRVHYLQKADAADRYAERASDSTVRDSFQLLAQSYRDLAARIVHQVRRGI